MDTSAVISDHVWDRVLCLDGGGIRGLIILEILEAIEKEAGKEIIDLFDWIGGTSTGGIIALGIATGKSVSEIREIYNRLKDQVFTGSAPYNSEQIETLMKKEFGETKGSGYKRFRRPSSVEASHVSFLQGRQRARRRSAV
ncbi:hypothetical protein DPMN_023792 [Dreissena polymorpha]|uniref:PNPLA domain-containing protein n=1 Tax=Dreissena polymorpha TaxID=45954 RepID=A0A9D4LN60_DREPO|nr:hypothetical protein DPMN_023792 [Dreissena polymorpha]